MVVVVVAHFALLHQLSERSCTIWWRGDLLLLVVESTVWWNHLVETRTTNGRNPARELAPTADTWDMVNGTPAPADFDAHQRCVRGWEGQPTWP